jgi:lysophospholipid acyltransferase (LPLAT)-like uncharacterized protein
MAELEKFTLTQRLSLAVITSAAWLLVRLVGPTLKYEVVVEAGGPPGGWIQPAVWVFWHRCIVPATWFFRGRRIGVMTSSSFDGEYIARIIGRFGFEAVRGSSTRGGVRALLGMHTVIEDGRTAAFTIDGPKGPRYVAKPGPVLLARNTQTPLVAFHLAVQRAWVLDSWDRLMIPKPFSKVALHISRIMSVPKDAPHEELARYHAEMQAALDRVRISAERTFGQDSAKDSPQRSQRNTE